MLTSHLCLFVDVLHMYVQRLLVFSTERAADDCFCCSLTCWYNCKNLLCLTVVVEQHLKVVPLHLASNKLLQP
jgi:hypothetical protein